MSRTANNGSGRPNWRARLLGGLLALVLVPSVASAQGVDDKYRQARESRFNLAAAPIAVLRVNQYQCGLQAAGQTCTDVFDSPTGGGGFWPTGSPNQYMFNSGIQVVGMIPMDSACTTGNRAAGTRPGCFPWSGDTVGAFFMDASGLRQHGTPLTDIYDSLNPDDLENWPTAGTFPDFPFASAMVEDTSLFNPVLIGRKAASQQDSWVMYWDGDPARTGGRTHPVGIVVEQRTLAWNYPAGNEATVYIIYKFTNVTNNTLFQRLNETRYAISLPDEGWRIDSMYVAYLSDPDVTLRYSLNYATAILPFNLGLSFDGQFYAPEFDYPPALFYQPFFTDAPGMVGVKYLKSPINPATGEEVGLTSFSLTTVNSGGGFVDPQNVTAGWRYISLNVDPSKGDPNCTFTSQAEIRARRSCFLSQTTADVRFFVGSGPFSLEPGQSATIAVAQYAAATVNSAGINPTVAAVSRGTGTAPSNAPGFPSLAPGCFGQPIRAIERAAGYVRPTTCPGDASESIDQFDVEVVPGSMLGKAIVAQSIFNNKFLLGFAPETPQFYLVPGDNRITVVWEPSVTETQGDPFFSAAGDPDNPLYDANYRQYDVEGYRIYRGTSPADLRLVAQFDHTGTTFVDRRCITDPAHVSTWGAEPICTDGAGNPIVSEVPLSGDFVQYTTVAELASGALVVLESDTALAGETRATRSTGLSDTGVPYAFVDTNVRNGFQYFYRVTAFDINSVLSGPSSLESAGPMRSAIPKRPASSLTSPEFSFALLGRGANPLTGTMPTIDAATGTFSGPMPPTDLVRVAQVVDFAAQLLPAGATEVITIDRVRPAYYPNLAVAYYDLTIAGQQYTFAAEINIQAAGTSSSAWYSLPAGVVDADPAARQQMRSQGIDAPPFAATLYGEIGVDRPHWHSGDADWAYKQPAFWNAVPPATHPGGSRWFDGANESMANPTLGLRLHGQLGGVNTIFQPLPYLNSGTPTAPPAMSAYANRGTVSPWPGCSDTGGSCAADLMRRFYGTTLGIRRAADVKIFWGAAGVDSVIDVTHNVAVPFRPGVEAGYGFLTDSDADGVLTYGDFYWVPGFETAGDIFRFSQQQPRPLAQQPVAMPTDATGDLASNGTGFGLHINGEPYLFQGAVPSNTVWTLRTYSGAVTQNEAGQYSYQPTGRNPAVPGLRIALNVTQPGQIVAATADLKRVHTVPDPYYATSAFDLGPTTKELQFVNLPAQATIRIYSLSGILVDVINHNDAEGGGMAKWDLRNRSNQFVASGVYLFHVSTPDGKSHVGKFTVVNSGFQR